MMKKEIKDRRVLCVLCVCVFVWKRKKGHDIQQKEKKGKNRKWFMEIQMLKELQLQGYSRYPVVSMYKIELVSSLIYSTLTTYTMMGHFVRFLRFLFGCLGISKVLHRLVLGQQAVQTITNLELSLLVFAIVQVCPELFKTVQVTILIIRQSQLLEVSKDLLAITLFKTIRVESEQAFETITIHFVSSHDRIPHPMYQPLTGSFGLHPRQPTF